MNDGQERMTRVSSGGSAVQNLPADQLYERVYGQLKRLAHRVRVGRAGETLNTTALVNEAWLKLGAGRDQAWRDQAHFFALAARAMRQILVDSARRRVAAKRGGSVQWQVTLDPSVQAAAVRADELLALDDALGELARLDPRRAAVVEQRYFAGLSVPETARALGISTATVERDWRTARAWLAVRLRPGTP